MSQTRRQSRDALERLDTPAEVTRALVRHLPALQGRNVVEPCAGANAITDVLRREAGCAVDALDIEPRADGVTECDTLKDQRWAGYWEDGRALVTNTPFSLTAEYWRVAEPAVDLIALLVRLSWLEATNDRADVRDPDALVIVPRVKFTGPGAIDPDTGEPYTGGDSVTVTWAIWAKDTSLLPARPIIRVNRRELAELRRDGTEVSLLTSYGALDGAA